LGRERFTIMQIEKLLLSFALFLITILLSNASVSAGPVSVNVGHIILSQPDSVLRERLSSVDNLVEYIKQIEAAAKESFQVATELKATNGAIVVAVRPGHKAKVWLMSSEYDFPKRVSDDFQTRFSKIQPASVRIGPIAFALLFTIKGGGKPLKSIDNMMPVPQEWQEVMKKATRPLLVPDDILTLIWPDDPS
jgi:hypothetical protein